LYFSRKQGNLKPSCSTVTFTSSESIRGRHENSLLFLPDFNKRRNVSNFVKMPNTRFHINPSIRNCAVPQGQTDRQTDWKAPSCEKRPENRPFRTHQM